MGLNAFADDGNAEDGIFLHSDPLYVYQHFVVDKYAFYNGKFFKYLPIDLDKRYIPVDMIDTASVMMKEMTLPDGDITDYVVLSTKYPENFSLGTSYVLDHYIRIGISDSGSPIYRIVPNLSFGAFADYLDDIERYNGEAAMVKALQFFVRTK